MSGSGPTSSSQATWTPTLEASARIVALDAGFSLFGIAPASFDQERNSTRFSEWIEAGRAGEMDYLKRRDASGNFLRTSAQVAIPWAQSIIVCAFNYDCAAPYSLDPAPADAAWIGRYAWSGRASENGAAASVPTDYHTELLTRLRLVEEHLHAQAVCETRCYVDTGPIVERNFAAQAGVGWIGKNTCVLNQQLGSWLLLGVIVTSLPIPNQTPLQIAADRCGSCTRCIEACPTDALVAPREMDASRCIAYLTIEKKGTIAEELRAPMGRQVFGCDICQDVCPWNGKAANRRAGNSPLAIPGMNPRPELINPSLAWLASLDSPAFKRWFKGSPLERTGRKRLHRNVAIAMGNSGETAFLAQLREWATGDDEVLAEAARWAIDRLQSAQPVC
jgi:epoxyqueuosine reductase